MNGQNNPLQAFLVATGWCMLMYLCFLVGGGLLVIIASYLPFLGIFLGAQNPLDESARMKVYYSAAALCGSGLFFLTANMFLSGVIDLGFGLYCLYGLQNRM